LVGQQTPGLISKN